MKHIVKILSILVAVAAMWIGLLHISIVPKSQTWLVSLYIYLFLMWNFCFTTVFADCSFTTLCMSKLTLFSAFQLPLYLIISLACYGLLMVGVGLMRFPTCPQEAVLLQQVSLIPSFISILDSRLKVN